MFIKKNIEFKTHDGICLRGLFFSPNNNKDNLPAIVMSHGFSALKDHKLEKFAEEFVNAGMCVLIYDNRNFGVSDAIIPFEVDPKMQVKDISSAIDFLSTINKIDKNKIGVWGTSFSGGNAIVAASLDKRIKCIVSQVPHVQGHHEFLKQRNPSLFEIIQKKYLKDKANRSKGLAPAMTPVVTKNAEKSAVMVQPEAYDFFKNIDNWQNQVTLKSLENSGEYRPIDVIENVSPIPLLFIVADQDKVCITDLQLKAFDKALEPKKLVKIKGHHFVPYDEAFDICSKEATAWFLKYL